MNALSALIKGAREARLSKYRTCPECGEKISPEFYGAADVCDGCAEEPPSVIH
jgi:NADH pyrophosphatase NudC (nudix superfamily)